MRLIKNCKKAVTSDIMTFQSGSAVMEGSNLAYLAENHQEVDIKMKDNPPWMDFCEWNETERRI
jgi:hypothetical protein